MENADRLGHLYTGIVFFFLLFHKAQSYLGSEISDSTAISIYRP